MTDITPLGLRQSPNFFKQMASTSTRESEGEDVTL